MHKPGMVSIWFLVGLLLTAYGLLISAAGVYQALAPPVHPPVLADLHAGIWWGLLILGIGLCSIAGTSSLGKRNKLHGRTRRCGNRELAVPEQEAQGFGRNLVSQASEYLFESAGDGEGNVLPPAVCRHLNTDGKPLGGSSTPGSPDNESGPP